MIVGTPNKANLFALPRAFKRVVSSGNESREKRKVTQKAGPFTAFAQMMERQADLIIRQMGE